MSCCGFFFQAEDGIRDLVRSRGLGDVYKRQAMNSEVKTVVVVDYGMGNLRSVSQAVQAAAEGSGCLLYTSDAADERSSVDLGGRRIIKKKTNTRPDEGTNNDTSSENTTK